MMSLADFQQDMQPNHMKFFESVQNYQARPASSSYSSPMYHHVPSLVNPSFSPPCIDTVFNDDLDACRPRSGSGSSYFVGKGKDELEQVPPSDEFPPISTFHVASPSPRKQVGHFQQGPPRSNRFRRGAVFRTRGGNVENRNELSLQLTNRKQRHDSYSSNEGMGFGTMTLQQQQAINNEASNGNNADFVGRYKTELCRPFMENGECKYGEKCQFAHGRHELKQMSRHPKYKTEYCRTFHTVGFCPYGPRCHFLHLLDLDNPSVQEDGQLVAVSSDEQQLEDSGSTNLKASLTMFDSNSRDSASPTALDEPAESVFLSPSPAAVSPVSSMSSCSEPVGTASSSGIGLSSSNTSSVSSNSPSARNVTEEQLVINDADFPPLPTSSTGLNEDGLLHVAPVGTSNATAVDRLHLLKISTTRDAREEMESSRRDDGKINGFSDCERKQGMQQKRQQQQLQQSLSERCVAAGSSFFNRLPTHQQPQYKQYLQPAVLAGPRSSSMLTMAPPYNAQVFSPMNRRLPIFSSLAN